MLRPRFAAGLITALLAGCGGGEQGAADPEEAVSRFLAVVAGAPDTRGGQANEEVTAFWGELCDRVDPKIRPALRFDRGEGPADGRIACGGITYMLVAYTGDTGRMAAPSSIAGTPTSAETDGDTSVVTVEMEYRSRSTGRTSPPPPPKATIKVLAVERDGSWWVATPAAFNPLKAADGGMTEPELRAEHRRLLDR